MAVCQYMMDGKKHGLKLFQTLDRQRKEGSAEANDALVRRFFFVSLLFFFVTLGAGG